MFKIKIYDKLTIKHRYFLPCEEDKKYSHKSWYIAFDYEIKEHIITNTTVIERILECPDIPRITHGTCPDKTIQKNSTHAYKTDIIFKTKDVDIHCSISMGLIIIYNDIIDFIITWPNKCVIVEKKSDKK